MSIELLDIVQHVLTGPLEGAGSLHFQRDQCGAVQKRFLDVRPLPLGDVAGEGGVAPAGAARQVPGLDGAGVDLLAVVSQDLGVVGYQNLLGAPAVQQLGGLRPVRQAGEDLCLGGIGLKIVDVGEVLLLLRPVVEGHGLVRLHMAQQTLDVHCHLAVLGGFGE